MSSTKNLAVAAFSIFSFVQPSDAASVLTDDFNDGVFDTDKWSASLPFPSSSFEEASGSLNIHNRAIISTRSQLAFPITISGSFSASQFDIFDVLTRSNLQVDEPYYHQLSALYFSFRFHDQVIAIQDSNEQFVGLKNYQLNAGQTYLFSINDDGLNVSLSVNGHLELSGTSSFSAGNYVAFHNRESDRGWAIPSSTSIDFFSITTSPAPEPASTILPIAGFAAVVFLRRKRRQTLLQ